MSTTKHTRPLVVITGRPNVGKSTLFNLIVEKEKKAIVHETAGVTRDKRYAPAQVGDTQFTLIDTAGLEREDDDMKQRMNALTESAWDEADIILLMVDGKAGLLPVDVSLARELQKTGKPLRVIVNKTDVNVADDTMNEAYQLGLGDPIGLSAAHNNGVYQLEELIHELWDGEEEGVEKQDTHLRMSIIGRPNAGKSTLVNALLEDERMLTGPTAGLTRESVGSIWEVDGQVIELVDTAGVRRKSRVTEELEQMSVTQALRAVEKADVTVLVLDGTTFDPERPTDGPFERQDAILAGRVIEMGKPLVVVLNKWDAAEEKELCLKETRLQLEESLGQLKDIPMIQVSALRGKNVERLLPIVKKQHEIWKTEMTTAVLNRFLEDVVEHRPPPSDKGRYVKLKFMSQVSTCPPTFAIWCNRPDAVQGSYQRYLLNQLR